MDEWPLAVPLKDIPGLPILRLFNIVAIYTSKFFPTNIEQCSYLGLSRALADSTIPF